MSKRFQKNDYLFVFSLAAVTVFYVFLLFQTPYLNDEIFYPTVPLRLINGESLLQHEWHLTQFSSLFQYLPVKLWLNIKGSSDGIILFIRCCYLLIHIVLTVIIYKFFRKKQNWPVVTALMFYTCLPYGMFALSYASLLVVFLVLFTLSLLSVYEKRVTRTLAFSGFFFGCMCICNPMLCFMFPLYAALFFMWPHKEKIITAVLAKKNKRKNKYKLAVRNQAENTGGEAFSVFFTKSAFLYSCLGLSAIALIAVFFFFSTGGTLASVFENIPNMLGTSEYGTLNIDEIENILLSLKRISAGGFLILPLFILLVYNDKNRKAHDHRLVYLSVAAFLSLVFMVGIFFIKDYDDLMIPFPFFVFSTTCYVLTENKNRSLFYCVWCTSSFVALIQCLASNTRLLALGVVLSVNNIAGVFFVHDLCKEMLASPKKAVEKKTKIVLGTLVVILCSQMVFQCAVDTVGKHPVGDSAYISSGPYAGLYIETAELEKYNETLEDIEYIKSISDKNDPILIYSGSLWSYLCIDRPFAINTAFFSWMFYHDDLKLYYDVNPERIPVYIYVTFDLQEFFVDTLADMFDCTQKEMSNGILLTVENYKLSEK